MEKRKAGRPRKGSLTISDSEKVYLRLDCLTLVMNNGSKLDAKSPQDKAEELYNFVMGNVPITPLYHNDVIVVEARGQEIETPKDIPATVIQSTGSIPFTDTGRKREIIS